MQKEIFVTTAAAPWILTWWNGTTGTWVTLTVLVIWLTAVRWVDVPSSGPQNYFSTFWIWQYSTLGYCYLHVGLNIPTEISGFFWWGIWLTMLERAKIAPPPRLVGRPSLGAKNVLRHKSRHNKHWPVKSTQLNCRLCSSRSQRKRKVYKCARCNVGLCVVPCFKEYHTTVNL